MHDDVSFHNVKDLLGLEMKIVRTILPVKVSYYELQLISITRSLFRRVFMKDGSNKSSKNRKKRINNLNLPIQQLVVLGAEVTRRK